MCLFVLVRIIKGNVSDLFIFVGFINMVPISVIVFIFQKKNFKRENNYLADFFISRTNL